MKGQQAEGIGRRGAIPAFFIDRDSPVGSKRRRNRRHLPGFAVLYPTCDCHSLQLLLISAFGKTALDAF